MIFEEEDGALTVEAGTSDAGPGYHAALVDALDRMADAGGFVWTESDSHADETGYFSIRDFSGLQASHADFMRSIFSIALRQIGGAPMVIALGPDDAPAGWDAAALTSRGPRDAAFMKAPDPQAHFAWRALGIGPTSAASLGDALAWTAYPWCAPLDLNSREAALERVIRTLGDMVQAPSGLLGEALADRTEAPRSFEPEPATRDQATDPRPGYRRDRLLKTLPGG